MADKRILEHINILNPKLKQQKLNNVSSIAVNNNANSINYPLPYNNNYNGNPMNNNNIENHVVLNEDEGDVLNLWSSTNFFFDPVDNNELNEENNASALSERERDRQRYNKLKESLTTHRAKHPEDMNGQENINQNFINGANNRNNLININGLHQLLSNNNVNNNTNNNNNTTYALGNSFLKIPSSDTNTNYPVEASSSHIIPSLTQNNTNNNNNNNINISSTNANNIASKPLENSISNVNSYTKTNNEKSNGHTETNYIYTQLLNSISLNNSKNDNNNSVLFKGKEIYSLLAPRTEDSKSKEIADKKKRRSAATMRCREKKRNQLQKKEQYIGYLKNHVLFLDGLISHMGNEINWLRKSYIAQNGEESLKEVYFKNGKKLENGSFNNNSLSLVQSTLLNAQQSSTSLINPTSILPSSALPKGSGAPLKMTNGSNPSLGKNPDSSLSLPKNDNTSSNTNININSASDTSPVHSNPQLQMSSQEPIQGQAKDPSADQNQSKIQNLIPSNNALNALINLSPEQRELLIKLLKKPDLILKPQPSTAQNDNNSPSSNSADLHPASNTNTGNTNTNRNGHGHGHGNNNNNNNNNSSENGDTTTSTNFASLSQNIFNSLNPQRMNTHNFNPSSTVFQSSPPPNSTIHTTATLSRNPNSIPSTSIPTSKNGKINDPVYYI